MADSSRNLGRAASAVAIVLSLVFVGLELRQNTKAQRAETRQGLADASRDMLLTIANDPAARRAWNGVFRPEIYEGRDAPELTFADTVHAQHLMLANLRNIENVYLQSLEGVIGSDALSTYAFPPTDVTRSYAFGELWQTVKAFLDPRFVQAFEAANRAP